jgi:hypothetical protein
LEKDSRYVLLVFEGTVATRDVRQAASEALEMAAKENVHRFLVDSRNAHLKLSILELYDLPALLFSLGFQRTHRLAVVHVPGSTHSHDLGFMETVFRNLGYNARLFTEMEDAQEWLDSR